MNVFDFLDPQATESIYYWTERHWTTNGAYLSYVAFAEQRRWQPLSKKDFAIETVSKSFLGSYHTRSQFTGLTPDTIQTYIRLHPVTTEMYIADVDKKVTSMYDESFLAKKDHSYFLEGTEKVHNLHQTFESSI